MRDYFRGTRKIMGQLGFLLLLVAAYFGLRPPFSLDGLNKQNDPLPQTLRETLRSGDLVIILDDDGAIHEHAQQAGADTVKWELPDLNERQFVSLASSYCPVSGSPTPPQRLFLAWNNPNRDVIYELGSHVRSLYLLFDFKRMFGTEGRLFELHPRQETISQYCSAQDLNAAIPLLVILPDSVYPLITSVQTGNITWAALSGVTRHPFSLVEQVHGEQGRILLDKSIPIDPTQPFFQSYAANTLFIGSESLILIEP